ncbi:MAG: hypothetical protein IJM91_07670 [Lachnospiraceae bacterium]|nr:hypothetical protein [Lachnospiraceae bacterium]
MIELVLVEGVSDVQLISYYMQSVYEWKHVNENILGITVLDAHEHIENLTKGDNELVLCGVGGNSKFASFVEKHRINAMIIEKEIASFMVVTDRDKESNLKMTRRINAVFENITFEAGKWVKNKIADGYGQDKLVNTYLLIIPENENGALESVIINALKDIPEEKELMQEVIDFIDNVKNDLVPELCKINKYNKAVVGTFFSVRNPENAMRSFGAFVSKVEWLKSESLKQIFMPLGCLGKEKTINN